MQYLWAFVNTQTNRLVWTTTGHPAVYNSREKARASRKRGLVSRGTRLVRFNPIFK